MMSKARFMALAIWILANAGVAEHLPLPTSGERRPCNSEPAKVDLYVTCLPALHSS